MSGETFSSQRPGLGDDPDAALMLAYQQGNQGAFEQIVQRNQQRVYAVVARFLGAGAEAEDLAQEVFLRVWRSSGRYRPTARFSTWLYRITANVCLNALRARPSATILSLDSLKVEGLASRVQNDPSAGLARAEQRRRIEAALDALPGQQKLAIILHKYQGLNLKDIADVLGMTPQAVKSLLSRARDNLRRTLQG